MQEPAGFRVTPGVSPGDGLVTVDATMSYDAQRRYQVSVATPNGPLTSRVFTRYAQTQAVVEELLRPLPGIGPQIRIQVDISAPQPDWLAVGQPVLIRAEPGQGREAAPGWIGAFLDGGVWVMGVGGREDALYGADELGDESELTPEQLAQIAAAVQRERDTTTVEVRLTYDADRRYRLSMQTPTGLVVSEPMTRTADAGAATRRMVSAAYGDAPVIPCLTVQTPPWLSKGQHVIIRGQEPMTIDGTPLEGREESFGWIAGFINGEVYVFDVGNEDGIGIYPPEDLDDHRDLTPGQLAQIQESRAADRTGAGRR